MTSQQIQQVREALEHFARIEVPEGSSDGTWVAKTLFGNTQVTAFSVRKARAALSLLDPVASEPKPSGAELIAAERQRQVSVEGWTREHDAQHEWHELALAAKCYIMASLGSNEVGRCLPSGWPWEPSWWKPSPDPIRNLVKAGALIAAEIDRLQVVSSEPAPAESKETL